MRVGPVLPGFPALIRDYRTRCLFHWAARDGVIDARSGQAGTFARTGTATGTDSAGNTITYRDHQPAFTTLAGKTALRLATAAGARWPFPRAAAPGALTAYVSFRHEGFGYTAGSGGLIALTDLAGANPRWLILGDGGANNGALQTVQHNGSSSVTSTLGSGVADGTDCEYLVTLGANGVVQVTRVTAAGAVVTSTASGSLAVNAFAGNLIRVAAPVQLYAMKIAAGARSLAEMRELG